MTIVNPSRLPVEGADDQYDFECEVPKCSFTSRGWHTEDAATARGAEHMNEHVTGELMTELVAFEQSVGFVRSTEPAGEGVTLVVDGKKVSFDPAGNVVPDTEPLPEE